MNEESVPGSSGTLSHFEDTILTDAFLFLDRWFHRWTVRLTMGLLAVSAALTFYQVLTRFVFENPSEWSEVASRTAIVWMVYLGISVAVREGAMLSVQILHDLCRGTAVAAWLDGLIAGCIIVFLAVAGWYGGQVAWAVRFQVLAGLDISISWAYLAVPVGCLLGVSATLSQVIALRRHRIGGDEALPHNSAKS